MFLGVFVLITQKKIIMEIIKKIGLTVWKISLVWLICVYIHFLLYMVFNLDWHFINAAVPATVGIAISIVGYLAIVGFKNLYKMRRDKKNLIRLSIFWISSFILLISTLFLQIVSLFTAISVYIFLMWGSLIVYCHKKNSK